MADTPTVICYRAKYSTPFGIRYLSHKSTCSKHAEQMLKLKTPYRAGWVYEGLV